MASGLSSDGTISALYLETKGYCLGCVGLLMFIAATACSIPAQPLRGITSQAEAQPYRDVGKRHLARTVTVEGRHEPPADTPTGRDVGGVRKDATAMVEDVRTARKCLKVVVTVQETGVESIHTAKHVLSGAFVDHGFSVVARDEVMQALQHAVHLSPRDDLTTARMLGSRLQADIVVIGRSKSGTQEKTYELFEGKRIKVGFAELSAQILLVSTSKVLMAEHTSARQAFDITGERAVQKAATVLAEQLLKRLDQFLSRDTIEYRLMVLNVNHDQAQAFLDTIRQVHDVQVAAQRLLDGVLELEVHVARSQNVCFQERLFTQLPGFEVAARERQTIYLRRINETTVSLGPIPAPFQPGYRTSWAVVIGINQYRNFPNLRYAVNDAHTMTERLTTLGFQVTTLLDTAATRDKIEHILRDELPGQVQPEDRVIIFFAGHGDTQPQPQGGEQGYILPVDAYPEAYDSSAISMEQLKTFATHLRAKHVLYIMDSCFSGLFLQPRGVSARHRSREYLTAHRAWQVFTAGGKGERAYEKAGHGLFTKVLLQGLAGQADLDRNGFVTASELFTYVGPEVIKASDDRQHPAFGRLGQGRGEFVFSH